MAHIGKKAAFRLRSRFRFYAQFFNSFKGFAIKFPAKKAPRRPRISTISPEKKRLSRALIAGLSDMGETIPRAQPSDSSI
jgi:hypothetical protein